MGWWDVNVLALASCMRCYARDGVGWGWDVNVHLHLRHACDATSGMGWGGGEVLTFTCACVMHAMLRQVNLWGGGGMLTFTCTCVMHVMLRQGWGGVGVGC